MVSKALAAEDGILHFELANIPVGNEYYILFLQVMK